MFYNRNRYFFYHLKNDCYRIVPAEFSSICVLTTAMLDDALTKVGKQAILTPCQLCYICQEKAYLVGFNGGQRPLILDGHVILRSGEFFIDTATDHLRSVWPEVPNVISGPLMPSTSSAFAIKWLDKEHSVWWQQPPLNYNAKITYQFGQKVWKTTRGLSSAL